MILKFTNISQFPKVNGKFIKLTEPPRPYMGYLYNWWAINSINFAPTGWKVPTDADFTVLERYLNENGFNFDGSTGSPTDTEVQARSKIAKSMAVSYGYPSSLVEGSVGNSDYPDFINKSSFSSVSVGYRDPTGDFQGVRFGIWWVSDFNDLTNGIVHFFLESYPNIQKEQVGKRAGIPIRLLYNGTGIPDSTITDYQGNEYDVIKIGSQYWTKQNWACTRTNDGVILPLITDSVVWSNTDQNNDPAICAYNNDNRNVWERLN